MAKEILPTPTRAGFECLARARRRRSEEKYRAGRAKLCHHCCESVRGRQGGSTRLARRKKRSGKVVPRGLEPRTLRLLAVRSNQLSYETHVIKAERNKGALYLAGGRHALRGLMLFNEAARKRRRQESILGRRACKPRASARACRRRTRGRCWQPRVERLITASDPRSRRARGINLLRSIPRGAIWFTRIRLEK